MPALAGSLVLSLALSACGGAARSAAEPDATGAPLPSDVPGTLAEMDRAEADLAQALGEAPKGSVTSTSPSAAPAAPGADDAEGSRAGAAAPSTPPRPVDVAPPKTEAKSKEDEAGGCNIAKRALGSLQRAAEHLCGLTGEGDSRCDTARGRAQRAAERVGASCPP